MGNDYTKERDEVRGQIAKQEVAAHRLAMRLNDNSHNVDVARINQKNLNAELHSQEMRLDAVIAKNMEMAGKDTAALYSQLALVQQADPSIRARAFQIAVDHDKPSPVMKLSKL